jgi:tetratricopeptide (TPR) repeat protein
MNRRERRAAAKEAKGPCKKGAGKKAGGIAPSAGATAALYDAALGHMRSGRYLDAQLCCEKALALDGGHADTLHLLGLICLHTKQFDHAVEWLSCAVRQEPKTLYLTTLGTALLQLGRGEEALGAFHSAIQLKPDDAELWSNLGLALNELKRPTEAIQSFQHALELAPRHWEAASNAAVLLYQAKRYKEALLHFDLCHELRPDDVQTLHLRGETLQKLKRFEEALADNSRAHGLDPSSAEACNGIGNSLASLGRCEEALPWYDKALALRERVEYVLRNKAIALEMLGRFDEAILAYHRAIIVDPNDAEAAWNLALLQLRIGNFEAGWAGREAARWKIPVLVAGYPKLSQPLWRGDAPIDGKTILVCPDEGLGDTIQFVRYVPMLAARGARVILMVQEPLVPLLSGLSGVAECVPRKTAILPAFDFHCPLTSLPLVFGTRLDSIPAETSYLPLPAADRVQAWEARLGPRERMRIGLVWSGNPQHNNDHNRSIPLHRMARILDADATFVSLQKEPRAKDTPTLLERTEIVDLTAHLVDFAETAALVCCLDLVITVDTSVAHLAAALGRATWILLPYAPDYRWLLGRDNSPWYPTVRLFRQDESRDYATVIDRVFRELQSLIAAVPSRDDALIAELSAMNARM